MCVKDIASRMIEKSSNVPRIIDRLEIKQLIIRTQGEVDGRQTVIALTTNGISTLESATSKLNQVWGEMVQMDEADATTLCNLLEQMRNKEV